ncbi:MAG: hypothetical protein QXK18_04900 [Candidatus Bathyarchaeia archaeon]
MFLGKSQNNSKLHLRPREIVEVKAEDEIISTLDENGTYEGLAFTAEMRKYCGKRFKVFRRVNKLLVESIPSGLRHIKDAVILEGVFCGGEVHGGCGKACPLIWKEIWLKRVASRNGIRSNSSNNYVGDFAGKLSSCQEISLIKATRPLNVWDFRNYFLEITAEAYPGIGYLKKAFELLKFRVDLHIWSGRFSVKGNKKTTPIEVLNLKPGEIVEVKSRGEILETLDFRGRNRGLQFMPEMLKYCGKRFRVSKRVNRMVVATSGKMRVIPNTVILEGVYCDGKAHGGCQRMCHCLWREIWLRRV